MGWKNLLKTVLLALQTSSRQSTTTTQSGGNAASPWDNGYRWSVSSAQRQAEVTPFLQEVSDAILSYMDVSFICGHRGRAEQDEAYATGKSKLRFPQSKHNKMPARAMDLKPVEAESSNRRGFYFMAGFAVGYAAAKGRKLRSGADWNMNGKFTDNEFDDLFHLEEVE